jgi:serine/threonine-protein kinase HipA
VVAAADSKPVWVWLPSEAEPVRCGTFTWRPGLGQFTYDPAYRDRPDARPLDPIRLPFSRSTRPASETRQDGLFGVFRDASPEGYGLQMLELQVGRALTNPLDRLEFSTGDGVGAIEVCDDIDRKIGFVAPPLEVLLSGLQALPEGVAGSRVVREINGLQATTMGGERPKLTVLHRGQLWLAKLQDRGDAPNSPLREYLAMKSAAAADIRAAEVEFHQAGSHQVLLVRRFDRHVDGARVERRLFASAHTALHLDSADTRDSRLRSYPNLAFELRRWCGNHSQDATEHQRELWRRMAFNALCGNGDDHPRNHGLIHGAGGWELAPAYDIAPYIRFSRTLALQVTRDGRASAARWALLQDCDTFRYEREEAQAYVQSAMEALARTWSSERAALGFKEEDAPAPVPQEWIDEAAPVALTGRRR